MATLNRRFRRGQPAVSGSPRGAGSPHTNRPRRQLNRRRLWLLVALFGVAAMASVLVTYHVSLLPPSLHPREVEFAVAKTEVLVDTPSSQLIDQRENLDLRGPPIQAQYYTLLLQTSGIRAAIAAAVGLRGQEISATGPFTLWDLTPATVPLNAQVAQPLPTNQNYRLLVDIDGVGPMLTLYGQAPTTRAATAIVATARDLLERYVRERARAFPVSPDSQVVIRPMGPVTAGIVDPGAMLQVMAFVFVIVLLLGGALVLALDRRQVRRRVRRHQLGRVASAPRAGTDAVPEPTQEPGSDDWPHTRRLLPWSLAVFVGAIFLMPIESITLPVHLPFGSTPDRVLLVIIVAVWLVNLVLAKGKARARVRLTRVHAILFAFVGVACLGIAVNGHELATNLEVAPTFKKLFVLASLVSLFIVAASSLRPREIWRFFQYILVLGVIVAIAAMVEVRAHFDIFYALWGKVLPVHPPASLDTLDNIGRLSVEGPTVQPLELASLLSMVLPIAIIDAINAKTTKWRLLYLLASAILLGGAVATSRKTSVVAPLLAVIVLTCYRPRPMLRGLLISAVPLFVVVHLAAPGQIGSTLSELLPGRITAVSTTTERTARYDAVRPDVMSHFLLGRGFESYDPFKYRILDNEYLGLLVGVGAIGLLLYVCMFGALFGMAHPLIRGPDARLRSPGLAAQASIAIVCISNALFDVLSFSHVSYLFFFIAAMTVALGARETRERRSAATPASGGRPLLRSRAGPGSHRQRGHRPGRVLVHH